MEFRILGPLEVFDGARSVNLGSPKQRAVLAVLLLEAGRVVSTDALIDRLWGDDPPPTATGTLQAYLSNLRKALHSEADAAGEQLIVRRANGYLLNVDPGKIDARRFEQLAQQGRANLEAQEFVAARQSLESALDLWKGNPLEDFALEDFASLEIARLQERRLSALEDLVEADLALGRHSEAVGQLSSFVWQFPLRERFRTQLMLALYRDARQAEALEVARSGRQYLVEELGIDPGPDLRRMEEAVLRQDPALDWRPVPDAVGVTPGPLLGRSRELGLLQSAADLARRSNGCTVLVAGEPGIGKTRLLEEFAAGLNGFEVVWGSCFEGDAAPPLWPWLKVLEALAQNRTNRTDGAPDSELIGLIGALNPDVAPASMPGANEADHVRFKLWTSVCSLLVRLAGERPLALLLDDLHWADVATLKLLVFIAREIGRDRILLVGTYRDVDLEAGHPLDDVLPHLARLPHTERLVLQGLDGDGVAACARQVAGVEPSPSAIRAIQDLSGGNPFFVTELIRLLEIKGELANESPSRTLEIPANVRDVILRRVAALPAVSGRVLNSAVMVGRRFQIELVARVEGLSVDAVLDALDPPIARRLIQPETGSPGIYRVSHALVRETLLESITTSARVRLHARLAGAIESLYGSDGERVFEIAHHMFEAAGIADVDKAIEYALRAAGYALSSLAFELSEEHLRNALVLTGRLEPGAARTRREIEAQIQLAGLLMVTKGYAAPEVAALLVRSRDRARELGDSKQQLAALWRLAAFHLVRADMSQAASVTAELMCSTHELSDPSWCWAAHHTSGIRELQSGRPEQSREHLEEALGLASVVDEELFRLILPEQDAVLSCQGFLAWSCWLAGEKERATELIGAQRQRADASGHPFASVFASLFACGVSIMERDAAKVWDLARQAVAIAGNHGFMLYETMARLHVAWAKAALGEQGDWSVEAKAALTDFEATGARMLAGFHYWLVADTFRRTGSAEESLVVAQQGIDRVQATGERLFEPELLALKEDLRTQLDKTAEAVRSEV